MNSIVDAQNIVEENHIKKIREMYFEKDVSTKAYKPNSFKILIPNLNGDIYKVPFITLVQHQSLIIKEANISFSSEIVSIKKLINDSQNEKEGDFKEDSYTLMINPIYAGNNSGIRNSINIDLKIGSIAPPEGMSRLLNHIEI
jgi:hypothetical protein